MSGPPETRRFGPWEIVSASDVDGGGEDALARDANGREVRLWIGEPGSGVPEGGRPAVEAAAAALSRVYHASLPRVTGASVVDGRAVLTVVPYQGRTLEERLREGTPDVPEALDLVRTVAAGLVKAHRQEVVHGAITSREILLAEEGRTLLLHAGLGPFLGPRPPRAPEDPDTGARPEASDVFSLARVLLECLLGRDPIRESPASGLPETALPPEWPEGLRRFLARSVAADPSRRIRRAEELAGDLAVIRASWDHAAPAPAPGGLDRRIVLVAGISTLVALALAARSCAS